MDRNTLTERQVFYIAEFNEEAAWLSFMHAEGWKLVKTTGFKYHFESCPQEEWIYQLDFRDGNLDETSYIQMYADYGWEFVTRFRHWYYFRKIRTAGDDMSIFSDSQSKAEMCRKVIRHHALILAAYFLAVMAFFMFMKCGSFFAQPDTFVNGLFTGASAGSLIGGLIGLFFVGNQMYRLRKMINRTENPISQIKG